MQLPFIMLNEWQADLDGPAASDFVNR